MSRSFGPIDTRADFFAALGRALAHAEGASFWFRPLQRTVRLQLRAMVAWTDHGRTPLLSERTAVDLGWSIARAREEVEGHEPAEWIAAIEETSRVSWYFECWPETDELARTERFRGSLSYPRTPTVEELRAAAAAIYTELVGTGRVDTFRPPDEAFQSKAPLFSDRMPTTSWVQWVLLPRLEAMVKGEAPIPPKSQLCKLCMPLAEDRALWPLLYALGALDDLFLAPMKNHEP
jgi:uncharacterized protein YqcC (DUF446 family)